LPDVPTLNELGFGGERVASWFALAAPAGTPRDIVNKLNELFVKASRDAELQRRLDENGTPIATSTPDDMGRAMEQEWQTMQQLAKALNLRPQ
jgi:tripartite-type tricarboxylate transporter receptor subunit TctC